MKNKSWSGEDFWVDLIEKKLYSPKSITFVEGVRDLVCSESLSGKIVLDYACGTGLVGTILQGKGAKVYGIDSSEKLLKSAGRHYPVQLAKGEELPFDEGSFDYVAAFMVFHIMQNLEHPLSEIRRVLKKEGKLLWGIVDPKAERWDTKTNTPFFDKGSYDNLEEREWVFHLTDGRVKTEKYFHRPWNFYEKAFEEGFDVQKKISLEGDIKTEDKDKYATKEFLLGICGKK